MAEPKVSEVTGEHRSLRIYDAEATNSVGEAISAEILHALRSGAEQIDMKLDWDRMNGFTIRSHWSR